MSCLIWQTTASKTKPHVKLRHQLRKEKRYQWKTTVRCTQKIMPLYMSQVLDTTSWRYWAVHVRAVLQGGGTPAVPRHFVSVVFSAPLPGRMVVGCLTCPCLTLPSVYLRGLSLTYRPTSNKKGIVRRKLMEWKCWESRRNLNGLY